MSRQQPSLSINGRVLPLGAGASITQQYEDFGGFSTFRFASGAALVQESWRRARTTISATGWVPVGLDDVDWSAPVTVGCVKSRSIQSASNVITIPAARRPDAAPYGFWITADGYLKPTRVVMAGDVATLDTASSAAAYQVLWYPVMTILAPDGVKCEYDAQGAVESWTISGEEP